MLLVGLCSALLGWIVLFSAGDLLGRLGFDLLTVLLSRESENQVIVVEMDEKSYVDLGQNYYQAWDRSLHARLLRKLKEDGAPVVVFDVFFAEPTAAKADADLAGAMREHARVAIGVESVALSGVVGSMPRFPLAMLRAAAATNGLVGLDLDVDRVVRRHYGESEAVPSLPWAAAGLAGARLPTDSRAKQSPRWLRYYGSSSGVFPRMSFSDALNQPANFFKGKYVFIGGAPRTKRTGEEVDTFPTPFWIANGSAAPGVEILATNFVNLLRGDWLRRASSWAQFLGVLLGALYCSASPLIRVKWSWLYILSGMLLCFGVAVWLFVSMNLWFSWPLYAGIQLPLAWLLALGLRARYRETDLRHVSREPAVVTAEAINPARPPAGREEPVREEAGPGIAVPDHQVVSQVGKGAYGEVWLARNAIGTYHAVKIIHKKKFNSESPYEREFRGVSKFMPVSGQHPGFVHILHVGRNEPAGFFYVIMEAADDAATGRKIDPQTYSPHSLASELRNRGRLPLPECVQLGVDLAQAVGALHQLKLIHRDIKPGNIIFVNGRPKLADIGLVTEVADGPNKVSYLGTRGYIPPEGPGSAGADIYSLGKVLYEAGMGLDCEQFPQLPTTLVEKADESTGHFIRFNGILQKACEPNPGERYHSAKQLEAALAALAQNMRPTLI